MRLSYFYYIMAALMLPLGVFAAIYIAAPMAMIVSIAAPLMIMGDVHQEKYRYSADKSQKITSGRFKGKVLMTDHAVAVMEREVLGESVEAMLERVCNSVYVPIASSLLADSTIRRLDEQLDPYCKCLLTELGNHHKSQHDLLVSKSAKNRAHSGFIRELDYLDYKKRGIIHQDNQNRECFCNVSGRRVYI